MIIIAVLFHTATLAPFTTAFQEGPESTFQQFFDYFIDTCFILDIIFTFMTPYERVDGSLCLSHKKIARNYIVTGPFALDVVASFPI